MAAENETIPDFLDYKIERKKAVEEMYQPIDIKERQSESEICGYTMEKNKFSETFAANLFRCKSSAVEQQLVAKVIDLQSVSATIGNHVKSEGFRILRFLNKRIPFRNLVDIYDTFLIARNKMVIIEEFPDTNLTSYVGKLPEKEHMNDIELRKIAQPLANAINYLHNNGIAHQNIAPHNIYFTSYGTLKLGMLEFAAICWDKVKDTVIQRKYTGTAKPGRFMAPETSSGQFYDPFKADMYSYGITLYFAVLKRYPFDSRREEQVEVQWNSAIYELNVFLKATSVDFIHSCCDFEPEKRCDIWKAVVHPYFSSVK